MKEKNNDYFLRQSNSGNHSVGPVLHSEEMKNTLNSQKYRKWGSRRALDASQSFTDAPASPVKLADESDMSRSLWDSSTKPPTTITIIHNDYEHHKEHPVNVAIGTMNKFLTLASRMKDPVADAETLLRLARIMGLKLVKKQIVNSSLKNREFMHGIKEKMLKYLNLVLLQDHGILPAVWIGRAVPFKFSVCKGNNGIMVRSVLKQRWWWSYGERKDENLNFLWTEWCKRKFIEDLPCQGKEEIERKKVVKISNHFESHFHLSNKKAMFINMMRYYQANGEDPFNTLPLTFHIREGTSDPEFLKFTEYYRAVEAEIRTKKSEKGRPKPYNTWIIKPGEYSNRGCGISVAQDYHEIVRTVSGNGGKANSKKHTYIVQKYIENPLLINKRKFDIRMYGMMKWRVKDSSQKEEQQWAIIYFSNLIFNRLADLNKN